MAFLKGCENVEHNLCSGQQNWTSRQYNACSEYEEKAQLELGNPYLVCYFVKLAIFLVDFCSHLPKWNLDYMTCLKQFGIPVGMCASVFPDLSSKSFLDCFNSVVKIVGERTNESNPEWFNHIQNVVCFKERAYNIGICVDNIVLSSVFSASWFASSETVVVIYSYVFPAVGAFVIFINIILLIVMLQIISNDSIKLLLCTITVCEILTVITMCSLYLGFFTTGRYHDYTPYGWCVIIMLIVDILTPLYHAASIWLTLGMAIQRYLIIKYPFKARLYYEGKKSRNAVLLYIAMTIILTSISHIPQLLCITKMTPWPVISNTNVTNVVVTATVKLDETFMNLRTTAYTMYGIVNRILPLSLMVIFEIALIRALRKHRKQHKEVTNDASGNTKIRLINILTSIIAMTVLIAEIPSAVVIFLVISGFSIELQETIVFLNFLPLVLYPANLVICCCIAKDFRDKFLEFVRRFTKC